MFQRFTSTSVIYLVFIFATQVQICVNFTWKKISERKLTPHHYWRTNLIDNRLRVILEWNPTSAWSLFYDTGNFPFLRDKCPHRNCYITKNRNFLSDITQYDAIIFWHPNLNKTIKDLPLKRSPRQKYVFATMESPHSHPILHKFFDNFFNWTLTYRLDSDVVWGYMAIHDKLNREIGPKAEMHWMENMKPINETMKLKLSSKQKAAAWFVSHCRTLGKRENLVSAISKYLRSYGLHVDVYGSCTKVSCPVNNMTDCDKYLERNYYFYFAFENSLTEDYVTEKLLRAITHDTVPVVYGGANYTRFMPDGMYLNAATLGPRNISRAIYEAMRDPNIYYEYFRYKNHYSYRKLENYCRMCALLNDRRRMKQTSVYSDLSKWWDH